jgi:hypothetical protein
MFRRDVEHYAYFEWKEEGQRKDYGTVLPTPGERFRPNQPKKFWPLAKKFGRTYYSFIGTVLQRFLLKNS